MTPPSSTRHPDDDLAGLGDRIHRAARADLRHRRRGLAGVGLVAGLAVGAGGPCLAASEAVPRPAAPPVRSDASAATTPVTSAGPVATDRIGDAMGTTTPAPPVPPARGQVPDPASLLVLVDHHRFLPPGYVPAELVEAPVPFTFSGPDPKRLLHPEAARALAGLFDVAARDGLPLAAVSGYRSEQTQRDLYSFYVARDGEEAASRISARPGHSEHQTGLAVDVTGIDGACPASACFAGRPEAAWLAAHAHEHGFVVRYPPGKEVVTGYDHEPWHLRYVGVEVAGQMARTGLTLDEHLGVTAPGTTR